MGDLTEMERKVLCWLDCVSPGVAGPEWLIKEAHPAFHALVERGLIERIYVLSSEGRAAIEPAAGGGT